MDDVLTGLFSKLADRYRIEREIGSGGMATVYLARDVKHDRDVALKILRPELAAVLGADRFLNEIRITARLDHPHILTLIDSGAADGFLYYVLPFVRGESLRDRLNREKQLGVDDALAITRQIGSALEYAHRQGVVHRDIKPENILIHEGEAMLTDFGIAMAVKEAGGNRLTETGLSLGTPQYMSPEQATGDRTLDARSDVYSLAAVLYEMLAGEPPHTGATVQAIIAKLMTERPTRLRVMRDTVPEGIDTAVAKALAKIPADRYANAGEFGKALAAAETPVRSNGRARRWLPVAIGGAVAVAALAAAMVIGRRKPPPPSLDRAQLTGTGNSILPSLSPDGSRLAFGEKECNPDGYCTYRLVIQDVDGTGRLVLSSGIAALWQTEWTRDGRFLVFGGSYGPTRWGYFAISTLGGASRRLGCCGGHVISGDTAIVLPENAVDDSLVWVKVVTAHDGQVVDSIPIRQPGLDYNVIPTSHPNRLLAQVQSGMSAPELQLIDYKGTVIDRTTPGFGSQGRNVIPFWVRGSSQLLIAVQREFRGREFDFLRLQVSASRIDPAVDTVLHRVELAGGWHEITPDGSRMVYASGPVETSIWAVDIDETSSTPFTSRQLTSSTTAAVGRISPVGDRIFVGRRGIIAGQPMSQLFTTPYSGGSESQLAPPVSDLLDWEWTPDAAKVVYLLGSGPDQMRLMEVDSAGKRSRETAKVDRSTAGGIQTLRDGGIVLVAADLNAITLTQRPGRKDVTWRLPPWLNQIQSSSPSPDGKMLALQGWDRGYDSIVVAQVDMNTGTFSRLGAFGGEGLGRVTWLNDGSLMFHFDETRGGSGLYRMNPGGRPRRIGALPHPPANYSVSLDGRRMAAFSRSDKTDVYMIRNLGEILRR